MNTETLNYLKSVILSQLLLETNEALSHTNRYRQDLKQQVNRTNKLIEPIVREEYDKIYESDAEMTTNILNKIESLVSMISQYQLEELVILEAVINKYAENKEWFLEHTASEFLRID